MLAPVEMASGCFNIQFGITRAQNMEKPKTKIFRDEFIFTYWKNKRVVLVHLCHARTYIDIYII